MSSLRAGMIAGAPSVKHCIVWFEKNLGCRLLNAYGMTEVSALAMADFNDPQSIRYEKCGRPCSHANIAILKDDGSFSSFGEAGEIICKSPGIMIGYYSQPEKTAQCYTADGWFKTGDIGMFDENGVLSITGRKKDIIIRNGYNVVPSEVESLYYSSGFIQEACVFGQAHQIFGECIVLFCSLKPGVCKTPEELRKYAEERISKYKVPDKVIILDRLPVLSNGKPDKNHMKLMCQDN